MQTCTHGIKEKFGEVVTCERALEVLQNSIVLSGVADQKETNDIVKYVCHILEMNRADDVVLNMCQWVMFDAEQKEWIKAYGRNRYHLGLNDREIFR